MGYSSSIFGYLTRISIFWWLLVFFTTIILGLIIRKLYLTKKMSALRGVSLVFLCEYLFIVLISTVLSRNSGDEYLYKLELFWSYRNFVKIGVIGVLFENVYNIFLLFPYGFLSCVIMRKVKLIWIWILGTMFSIVIEFMQLVLKKGYFELDDIFHNTMGVLLGVLSYKIIINFHKNKKGY